MLSSGVIDVDPSAASSKGDGLVSNVDTDTLHTAHIDDKAILYRGFAARGMAACDVVRMELAGWQIETAHSTRLGALYAFQPARQLARRQHWTLAERQQPVEQNGQFRVHNAMNVEGAYSLPRC